MPLQQVLEFFFGVQWWIYTAAGAYGVFWLLLKDCYKKNSTSWKRINGWLIQDTWGKRYRDLLSGILDRVDRFLTPEIAEEGWKPQVNRSAWSFGLLNLSLLLAIVYPILSMLVIWIANGEPGKIGSLELLPKTDDLLIRGPIAAGYAISALLLVFSIVSISRLRVPLLVSAIVILFSVPFLLRYLLPEVPFATAFAAALALAYTGAFALAAGGTLAFAAAAVAAGAFALAAAGALGAAAAFVAAGALAFIFAGAGAGAFAFATFFLQRWWGRRTGRPLSAQFAYLMLLLLSLIAAVLFGAPRIDRLTDDASLILFLGFLPMLNALADFASTGLTRFCLRRGLSGSAWKWALYDLLGAAAIFGVLVLCLIAVAEWVRWPGGIALIDLTGTLADIRANPRDYWWLYITFLSTLLPTALHASVAIISIGLTWFKPLRGFIVDGLTVGADGDSTWGMAAVWVLSVCLTVSLMIPVLIIGSGIPALPWIGFGLLSMFEWIAGLMAMV